VRGMRASDDRRALGCTAALACDVPKNQYDSEARRQGGGNAGHRQK